MLHIEIQDLKIVFIDDTWEMFVFVSRELIILMISLVYPHPWAKISPLSLPHTLSPALPQFSVLKCNSY